MKYTCKICGNEISEYSKIFHDGMCYSCGTDCLLNNNVDKIVTALIDAGYGNVSEYKAEIERLRTTLDDCNTELNNTLETLRNQCREIGKLKAEVKQAQIDVLNKLRSRISDRDSLIQSYVADGCLTIDDMYTEIDELIGEIDNVNSKGTN